VRIRNPAGPNAQPGKATPPFCLMRRYFSLFMTMGLLLIASQCPAIADMDVDGVPLPDDVSPLPGNSEASPFTGIWMGEWDGFVKTILIVEAINNTDKASVVYAIGDSPFGNLEANWLRGEATIAGEEMTFATERFSINFKLESAGKLRAIFGQGMSHAIMYRSTDDLLRNPDAEISWNAGISERLKTGLVENQKPVELETVLFKPEGDGPFPLAIVNHGSTGDGDDPDSFGYTWTNPWLADILTERGLMVAFVQRRGRGQSDGLYDEGFSEDRSMGYTCDAEISLAGADRAIEDVAAAIEALRTRSDVTSDPILMAGVSRGGALSIAYSGRYPKQVRGVINYVGGWIGNGCSNADQINQTLFKSGAAFRGKSIWLYGHDDAFYSMAHSRKNFEAFSQSGGQGSFHELTVGGDNNGHWVISVPPLWESLVTSFLAELDV